MERQAPVLAALEPEAPGLVGRLPGQGHGDEALLAGEPLPQQLGPGVDHVVDGDLHRIYHGLLVMQRAGNWYNGGQLTSVYNAQHSLDSPLKMLST